MPICPNCGSYIPLGNHSCECGTTIDYDLDDGEYGNDLLFELDKRRKIRQRQNENPYDDDFFNELHHQGASPYLINRMNDDISKLKRDLGVELEDVEVMGQIAVFKLVKHDKYYDARLKATYDLSSAFNHVKFHTNLVIPDFSRLYADDEFVKLIKKSENEMNAKFQHCKLNVGVDWIEVLAMFDGWGHTLDLERMELLD